MLMVAKLIVISRVARPRLCAPPAEMIATLPAHYTHYAIAVYDLSILAHEHSTLCHIMLYYDYYIILRAPPLR